MADYACVFIEPIAVYTLTQKTVDCMDTLYVHAIDRAFMCPCLFLLSFNVSRRHVLVDCVNFLRSM